MTIFCKAMPPSASSALAPLGNLALRWKDSTTTMTLAYGVGITPSFQFQSAPLRTQVLSLNLTQETGLPDLLGVVGLNFGHGGQGFLIERQVVQLTRTQAFY